jgi:thioredoxin reductase
MSIHVAQLFRQLSDDIVYFTHTTGLSAEQATELSACGIRVVEGIVTALDISGDGIAGVRLADGIVVPRTALAVAPRMVSRADFLSGLGLHLTEHPSGAGEFIPADPVGRAAVPGIWLAGNVTDPQAQVGAAAAAGAMAGAQINADLVAEEVRAAVAAHGEPFSASAEAQVAELAGAQRRHGV